MSKTNSSDLPRVHKARSWQSDILSVLAFVVIVAIGVFIINVAVFRSYSVTGPSMEPTFYTNDRIIVNRLPVTWAKLQGKSYVPERGQIIVFENPSYENGNEDKYIVKRVIAFPGERVQVRDCEILVFNSDNPNGFNPYDDFDVTPTCVSGSVDQEVAADTLFVIGDNRNGHYSLDSRTGLGLIPYDKVIGPVGMQIYPFDKFQLY